MLPSSFFIWEPLLPQRLKQHQRDAVRQIQRTRFCVEHRNPQPVFTVPLQKRSRQPRRLAPENQIIIRRKFCGTVKFRAVGFDKPKFCSVGFVSRLKFFPILPAMPFHLLPVIHARALELRVIQLETKRLDEMQNGFSRSAIPRSPALHIHPAFRRRVRPPAGLRRLRNVLRVSGRILGQHRSFGGAL